MKRIKIVFVFTFLVLVSFQPQQEYETIAWHKNWPLTWNDFQGDTPINARAAAITASGISYRFSTSGTKDNFVVDFKIDTFFYPTKSWYQPILADAVILSHEQLHFDISELFARKFNARLNREHFTHDNVKKKVKTIYREILKELDDYQNQYDEETNYSRNRDQQQVWNQKIAKALDK